MELFYVVFQDDSIIHEGTEAECRAFLENPITKEIAEAGGYTCTITSKKEWMLRNVYSDAGLKPSPGGAECLYNGNHHGIKCGCDECEYLQTCTKPEQANSSTILQE
jgi:hypothetical protein